MNRRMIVIGVLALAACAPAAPPKPAVTTDPASQTTASRLAGAVYKGEWRQGFLYEITFPADLSDTAEVYVIDSDAARTEYRMPTRVEVSGNGVKLRFTKINRVDHLTFDDDRLAGYTVFNGQRRSSTLAASRVEG